ncbi:hypothetical protein [Rickettsia hoogstraalii]|uniref:hypothetical protein n=1 Tax=Rickettsia hoogstraalii TaxID=467174 RepID=UPI0018CF7DE7|nr:hypothetical protein [Rickettsia hoogstraalii]
MTKQGRKKILIYRIFLIISWIAPSLRSSQGVVAWISFTSVIPWLDHGIQLKILILLVFFIVFMDLVSKPLGDPVGFNGLRNNASSQ